MGIALKVTFDVLAMLFSFETRTLGLRVALYLATFCEPRQQRHLWPAPHQRQPIAFGAIHVCCLPTSEFFGRNRVAQWPPLSLLGSEWDVVDPFAAKVVVVLAVRRTITRTCWFRTQERDVLRGQFQRGSGFAVFTEVG